MFITKLYDLNMWPVGNLKKTLNSKNSILLDDISGFKVFFRQTDSPQFLFSSFESNQ